MLKKFGKINLIAFLAIALVFVLAACNGNGTETGNDNDSDDPIVENGNGDDNGDTTSDTPSGDPGRGLVVATIADAVQLDPQGAQDGRSMLVKNQIFERLVTQNYEMGFDPGLAESWTQIDDLTIEFNLRQDVYFHNGERMTAADVVFTLQRAVESPHLEMVVGSIDADSIEMIDEFTVRLATSAPFAPLLSSLSHVGLGIVSEAAVTAQGEEDFARNPVGTGPFAFDNWVAGDRVELVRFENYHGQVAGVPTLTFRVVSEAFSRFVELETGGVDIALDIAPSDIARINEDANLALVQGDSLRVQYIGFNFEVEPFDDVRVRQALNYAVDAELIIQTLGENAIGLQTGPMSPGIWGANPDIADPHPFNPDRARELLAEAGFPDGFNTTLTVDGDPFRVSIMTAIAHQLGEVGVNVDIQTLEWAAYQEATFTGEHALASLGHTATTGDADNGLWPLFHTSAQGRGGNRTWYSNPEVDALLEAARGEMDREARLALYFEIQEIIVGDAPWINVFLPVLTVGTRSDVNGFEVFPGGRHNFGGVYFE